MFILVNEVLALHLQSAWTASGKQILLGEEVFSEYGVNLRETAHEIVDRINGFEKCLVFNSRETIFKLLAIMLIMSCTSNDVLRSLCVKHLLVVYEGLEKEEFNQCDLFLTSFLKKLGVQERKDKSKLITLLCFVYSHSISPLFDVIDDALPENQTLFLVEHLAYERRSDGAPKNIDLDRYFPDCRLSFSPLIYACEKSSPEVVRLMIKKSPEQINRPCLANPTLSLDLYIQDYRVKITAIHAAAARGDVNVLLVLLESGADLNLRNSLGETPLHVTESAACVDLLIKHGADVNALDYAGVSALHMACYNRFSRIKKVKSKYVSEASENNRKKIRSLIQAGARVNQQDEAGNTPLHYAVKAFFNKPFANTDYSASVVAILCENGANPNLFNKPSDNNDGVPPLLYLYQKRPRFINYKFHYDSYHNDKYDNFFADENCALKIANLLLQYGACSTACSSEGYTILHMLAQTSDSVAMTHFLGFPEVKALVNHQTPENRRTPLHFAVDPHLQPSSIKTMNLLLGCGADLSLTCSACGGELTACGFAIKMLELNTNFKKAMTEKIQTLKKAEKSYALSIIKTLKERPEPKNEEEYADLIRQAEQLVAFIERICKYDKSNNHLMVEIKLWIASYNMSRVDALADVPMIVSALQVAEKFSLPNGMALIKQSYFELANRCLNLRLESKPFRLAMAIGFLKKAEVDCTRFMAELMGLEMSADVGSMEALQKNYPIAYHHATQLINHGPTTCVDPQGVYIAPQSNQHFFWHQPALKIEQPQADQTIKPHQ